MPRCAEASCGRWRPERLAPGWAVGIRLNGAWYCSRLCVQSAARTGLDDENPDIVSGGRRLVRLGALLRQLQVVSELQLREALDSQRASGCRLGEELIRRRFVGADHVLRGLAAQAGVSYLSRFDLARVSSGPSRLPVATVHALGLVPFELNRQQRVARVICGAPVPRAAVRALQRLTGWDVDVYLVDDSVWAQALREYRPASSDAPIAEVVTVPGLDDAAAAVAEAASVDREVVMRHASWDRFTWVQVEGATQTSTLLVPGTQPASAEALAR